MPLRPAPLALVLVLALACLAPSAAAAAAAAPRGAAAGGRELVVFTLLDATRADHLGCYGYGRPTTPTLDALAARGSRFTEAYCNAPWTRPSTASFLTGLRASAHRTQTETSKLPDDVPTLAERLQRAGWQTAGFVANGHAGSLAGLQRGFDVFEDPSRTYPRGQRGKTYLNGLPTGDFVVQRAIEHIAASRAPRLFVFLFLVDAHDPYEAPPELERAFLGASPGPVRRRASWEINNDYPAAERQSMVAAYDAGLRSADRALGRLVDALTAQGRLGETTFVVSADHGEAFGEHHFYLHAHHFWDEVMRIPLILAGPAWQRLGAAPAQSARLTQSLDVGATLMHLCGASEADLPGRSLGRAAAPGAAVVGEYNEFGIHRQAIVDAAYKVVWQRPADLDWYMRTVGDKKYFPSVNFEREVVQAFDRRADPQERRDLAAAGAPLPAAAAALLARLRAAVPPPQAPPPLPAAPPPPAAGR